MGDKKSKKKMGGARPGAGHPVKYNAETPQKFADLLRQHKTLGAACQAYGIGRTTLKRWREEYPEFAEAISDAMEDVGDIIESALFKRIERGDTTAIIFAAKTRLRDRGYQERRELTGADGAPLVPNIVFEGELSPEEEAKI